jgi:hypothetical protein
MNKELNTVNLGLLLVLLVGIALLCANLFLGVLR